MNIMYIFILKIHSTFLELQSLLFIITIVLWILIHFDIFKRANCGWKNSEKIFIYSYLLSWGTRALSLGWGNYPFCLSLMIVVQHSEPVICCLREVGRIVRDFGRMKGELFNKVQCNNYLKDPLQRPVKPQHRVHSLKSSKKFDPRIITTFSIAS